MAKSVVTRKTTSKKAVSTVWPFETPSAPTPEEQKTAAARRAKAKRAEAKAKAGASKSSKQIHSVKATISSFELTKAGSALSLEVYASKLKLGEIIIGQGSLYWFGRGRQKSKRIAWSKFAEMMDTDRKSVV